MSESTAVAKPANGAITEQPAASRKFLEAYAGTLGKLSPDQQTRFLIALGEHVGVRAELGEIILYQGKPYITIDGRIRVAHQSGLLVGLDTRPATQLERRNYGAEEGEQLWVCSVHRRGATRAFTGWGAAGGKNDRNPVSKQFPREMAKKRAKYDALRVAFPPAEQFTELHTRYIEEAEREAASQRLASHPLIAATYDDPDTPAAEESIDEVRGEEAAASAAARPDATVEELRGEVRRLAAHSNVTSHHRDMILERVESFDVGQAKNAIAALESLISPPSSTTADTEDGAGEQRGLGLGTTRRPRNAVTEGR